MNTLLLTLICTNITTLIILAVVYEGLIKARKENKDIRRKQNIFNELQLRVDTINKEIKKKDIEIFNKNAEIVHLKSANRKIDRTPTESEKNVMSVQNSLKHKELRKPRNTQKTKVNNSDNDSNLISYALAASAISGSSSDNSDSSGCD